jgi:hypothetical protein
MIDINKLERLSKASFKGIPHVCHKGEEPTHRVWYGNLLHLSRLQHY